ncbi:MAG: MotA/TolQ/ExbB proton channel family protein [Kiritimatiellae bacterium]|nr:MotA/TolQ/ExbB proton channel family protein [Kiritimatiellia bacterium]
MMQLLELGGVILWVILGFSFIIVLLILQRALTVHRASLRGRDFLRGIFNNLQRGNLVEAAALCEESPGPVPQMARVAILEYRQGGARLRQVMEEVGVIEIARLEKNLPILLALAQMAPVLGLLGTVVGMWDMFMALHQQAPLLQSGDLGLGMSRALITTMAGLGACVVGYFGHAFIVNRISAVVLEMEQAYTEIMQELTHLDPAPPKS